MWLMSTRGFYSVVRHRDDPGTLLVRCRAQEDIEALRDLIPSLEPFRDGKADYPWRAVVSDAEWSGALAEMVAEIDYSNFKDAVKAEQGEERASAYMQVWSALSHLGEGSYPDLV